MSPVRTWVAGAATIVAIVAVGACGSDTKAVPLSPEAAAGQMVAQQNFCFDCHSTNGSPRSGPTWKGLWGSTVTLQDEHQVVVDDAYVTESIRDPKAKITKGYPATMPAVALSDQQIAEIIAYLKTLSPSG